MFSLGVMIRRWIQQWAGRGLHVEGNRGFFQKFQEQESWRKTLKIVAKQGFRLQYLNEYVDTHRDCLLSPLLARHERFPACAIQKVIGIDERYFRQQWKGIEGYEIRADFGASLKNVSLWGFPFFVLTEDQVLLRDCSWDLKCFRKAAERPPVTKKISGRAIILPLHRSKNYYHWVIEVLPRIQLLMEEGLWNRVPVIVPPLHDNQLESLMALGLNPELLIPFDPECDHFKIEEGIYPSRLGAIRKASRSSVDWLRAKLVPSDLERKRKIYYSRSGAKTRRVLNESEFLPELVKRGFEIFTGEGVSFNEQIRFFAEAKLVVGAHGAGLSNLVFCAPRTPVIELMGRDYVNPCFGELCDSGRNPYSVIVGAPKYKGHYVVNSTLLLKELEEQSNG